MLENVLTISTAERPSLGVGELQEGVLHRVGPALLPASRPRRYVSMCIYIYIYIYIYINIHTYIYIYIYIHTHIHTYTHIHTHIHTYTHTHIHSYIHTHIHTYTNTHIHTYTRPSPRLAAAAGCGRGARAWRRTLTGSCCFVK